MTLRAWFDKLMGQGPKAEEPAPAEPTTHPSHRDLTEEEQAQRGEADEPDIDPGSFDPQPPPP